MKNTTFRLPTIKVSMIVIVAVCLLIPNLAISLDRYPADLNLSTVQKACDEVTDAGGGNIYLPAGTSPWWNSNLKLMGGVNLIGAGSPHTSRDANGKWGPTPTTIIRCAVSYLEGIVFINSPWYTKPPRYKGFRIANIKFLGGDGVTFVMNSIAVREGTPGFRIDHCEFDDGNYQVSIGSNRTGATPLSTGVIDHCNIINSRNYGVSIYGGPNVDNKPLGTADAIYIEDSYFTNHYAHGISGFCNAHWVARYNVFGVLGAGLDVHGPGWCVDGLQQRSGGPWEIYNNAFVEDPKGYGDSLMWMAIRMRGMHGVIFNNHFENFRHAANFTCDAGSCSAGLDAPGRSGSTTPGIYIWNNTFTNVVPDVNGMFYIEVDGCTEKWVRKDIEVFGYNDGVGVDHGVARPGYTPYTYPHPLTLGDPPPPPPQNLRIIKP